jgi:hypothetical protein
MPPGLDFFDAEPAQEEPELAADECGCTPADAQYLLTIEEGVAVIVHAACGKQPPSTWGDWADLVVMDQPIPVTAEWVPDCDGFQWHGDNRCDCGATVQLTPAAQTANAPQPAAARDILSAKHHPAYYHPEYGKCLFPGYRVEESGDGRWRVDHRMPEPDLMDPNRPSSDDMAAERHRQVDAYAATLTAAGWDVERRTPFSRQPYLLASPAGQDAGEE